VPTQRGYFGIGIVGGKTPENVGTLWRSAGILGASFIFTAGARYPKQASDTIKAWKHTPFHELDDPLAALDLILPLGCVPVAVETGGRPLATYRHPERAIYILGAESTGIPEAVLERCRDRITIPGDYCLNVSVAGSIVMYDRIAKGGG
jgi:tRNA G18 (ribose-2'-O)-methylase SpoU